MLDGKNPLIADRLKKLEEIRDLGVNPYPYSFAKTHSSATVSVEFSDLKPEEHATSIIAVAGRVMTMRRMGKATFCHIQDDSGKLQLYFRFDDLGEGAYGLLKKSDIGDIIGVTGEVFRTKMGELTVYARTFVMLTKSVRPLPEKFHGLQDPELRYRKRYLDLIMNPHVKEVFLKRAKIMEAIRSTLNNQNFLEVETPILQPLYGGANARPFKSHLHSLNFDVYLRISNELYLKRLVVGGIERVYEFAKDFRNEGIDKTHNPEFTQIEIYKAWADYTDIMKLTEELFVASTFASAGSIKIKYQNHDLDFSPPFERITMRDAIRKYGQIDVDALTDDELFNLRTVYNLDIDGDVTRGTVILKLFETLVEDKLIQPTFVTEHPLESTPLCKPARESNAVGFVERFELFIAGMECANAYSELNDPILQRLLLEEQASKLRSGSQEANPMDEDFVQAIEYGMPPTGGVGIGIDRMVMLLTNCDTIRDVIFFPFMRPVPDE